MAKTPTTKTTAKAKTARSSKKAEKKEITQHLRLVKNDEWLAPFEAAIEGRHQHALAKISELTNGGK